MKNSFEQKLILIISKSLKISKNKVNINLNHKNCKNWDSFNFLTLITNIEKNFKIKFNYKEMIRLNSYKNIKTILKKKLYEKKK